MGLGVLRWEPPVREGTSLRAWWTRRKECREKSKDREQKRRDGGREGGKFD